MGKELVSSGHFLVTVTPELRRAEVSVETELDVLADAAVTCFSARCIHAL